MAKHKRQKNRGADKTASGGRRQSRSEQSSRGLNLRNTVIWAAGTLLVIAVAVAGWTVIKGDSSRVSKATETVPPRAEAPVKNLDTAKSQPVSGSPSISFPEPEHNFDTIAQGAMVSHKFTVRNVGNAPLRLIRAQGT